MSRVDDAADLDALLAKVSMHSRLARVALKRVPEGGRDAAWLDALDEVREVLDLVTGVRVKFGKWSDEANKVGAGHG
jgi:hypothetical protein